MKKALIRILLAILITIRMTTPVGANPSSNIKNAGFTNAFHAGYSPKQIDFGGVMLTASGIGPEIGEIPIYTDLGTNVNLYGYDNLSMSSTNNDVDKVELKFFSLDLGAIGSGTILGSKLLDYGVGAAGLILGLMGAGGGGGGGGGASGSPNNPDVLPIPAPGAILLAGIGIGIVGWLKKRRTI